MADSWGTIAFNVLADGLARAQGAEVSITHIPGGDASYIDYGGQTPLELNYNLLMSEANYRLLEANVGGTAALVSEVDGTITSTLLRSLTRSRRIPVSGTTFAAASFTVVAL